MIHIAPLTDVPHHIDALARWHFAQWGYLDPRHDVPMRVRELAGEVRDGVPLTFVALDDDTLLGSASIVAQDLPTHPHLTPWLASVYVDPPNRRRGIASALVDRVVVHAATVGVGTLYLFTPDQERLYDGLGWRKFGTTVLAGETETLMRIEPGARVDALAALAR
ncbi:MAG: GNAT family N-acetyltransferase [Myxococcales bacterium]|nr:GNAT family N-acetyltransferase [Myxococcales bacterium]